METVKFQCGHCGSLMAVGATLLGKQVRCPNCRQVVMAPVSPPSVPAPVANTGTDPVFRPPVPGETESIFTSYDGPGEDVLGGPTRPPQVEEQERDSWPNLQLEGKPAQTAAPPTDSQFTAPLDQGVTILPPTDEEATAANSQPEGEWSGAGDGTAGAEEEENSRGVPLERRPAAAKGGITMALVALVFLLPYAVMMTVVAVYFYHKAQKIPQGLEAIPDMGEDRGVHQGGHSQVYDRIDPDSPLPARLKVSLHQAIEIGDLRVVPQAVERRSIVFGNENKDGRVTSQDDALVVKLDLKNISGEDSFCPTDPEFERYWKKGAIKPYTFLDVGGRRFYGGAIKRDETWREFVEGTEFHHVLKPGEQMTAIVTTDPENPEVWKAVENFPGPMVWRVHLRRGPVPVGDKEVWATAVIGVEFTAKDVQQK